MARKARTSLEARLSLLIMGILFVVLLGIGHFAIQAQMRTITEHAERQFDLVARALSIGAGQISSRDVAHLIKNSESGLKYVLLTDSEGRTISSSSRLLTDLTGSARQYAIQELEKQNALDPSHIYKSTLSITLPDGRNGILTAGWDTTRIDEELFAASAKILLLISVAFIIGIVLSLALAKSISAAVRPLTQCARSVAAGNLTCKAPHTSAGELGELTQSFNYMIEVLSSNQEQLLERANTDALTGLYNHRYFQERLADEVHRAERYGGKISLLMIDIDFFKNFNDDHGHPAGDAALHSLAQVLMDSIRDTDVPVRYGGEEFAVILPETGMREALLTAERIRKSVENQRFTGSEGEKLSLTVSVGASEYPTHASDRTGLISTADIALYQSKAKGRNKVECYSADSPAMPKPDPHKLYVLLHTDDMTTIEALAEAIDAKLKLPAGHSRQVAKQATAVARKMGLTDAERSGIQLAALLRDVGQIAVPDAVLGKSATLSEDEMAEVATHPMLGHAIIQKAPHLSSVLPAILHHHEHYNGTGYPAHLAADQIPLAARIIAVADAYQSMLIPRPHRKGLTPGEAQMELAAKSGSQFDPGVVQAFLEVLTEDGSYRQAA